ncbi:MAG: multiprotein bridging factor aMBF1 [Nitrososphaeria archaeon]
MSCELCGAPLKNKGKKILISGAILYVCDKCAKYGSLLNPSNTTTKGFNQSSKPKMMYKSKISDKEVEYEVVEDYAERIKNARNNLGWTMDILAEQVKEKVSVIKRIESGRLKPSLDLARRLEHILKIRLLDPVIKAFDSNITFNLNNNMGMTLGDVAEIKFKSYEKRVK